MMKVYVGEDTPTQALFLKRLLDREEELEPVVFGDGLELFQAVQQQAPDLILCDIMLPKLDGMAIARLLKFHDETHAIPFILVSSMSRNQIPGLESSGVDAFLSKPLKLPALKETIQRLLH